MASSSRYFDFGSDDVLCSYDDFAVQEVPNSNRPDPSIKDFHESRIRRPLMNVYEQDDYSKDDIINSVEKCMKKHADNLLRFLEGMSGRLSQVEKHYYKLERSFDEFQTDIVRHQAETDQKLRILDKHVQEVHKSIQILRDKQELAETQKELAKLQMVQKESAHNESVTKQPSTEGKKMDDKQNISSQQTAPAPSPQAVAPPVQQQASGATAGQQGQYSTNQSGAYFDQHHSFPQDQQSQTVHAQAQYAQPRSQLQGIPAQESTQQPQIINHNQAPTVPQYQQQWPQQSPQQFPQVMQPPSHHSQTQLRPQTPPSYSHYASQPGNPVPETFPSSVPMQVPYSTPVSQPNTNRPESVPFGYGAAGSVTPPNMNRSEAVNYGFGGAGSTFSQPSQHANVQRQNSFGSQGPQPSKTSYASNAPYPPAFNVQGYESTYGYQPNSPQQVPRGNNPSPHNSQTLRNHPFGDMIEKAVGMGYQREQVASVIQRLADSGQPIDFNIILDMLNGQTTGGNARRW